MTDRLIVDLDEDGVVRVRKLASQYGARVQSDVEAALYRSAESGPPTQFLDLPAQLRAGRRAAR